MDLNGTTFSSVKFDDLSKARGGIFNRRRSINKFDYSLICACDKPVNSYSPLFVETFFFENYQTNLSSDAGGGLCDLSS